MVTKTGSFFNNFRLSETIWVDKRRVFAHLLIVNDVALWGSLEMLDIVDEKLSNQLSRMSGTRRK